MAAEVATKQHRSGRQKSNVVGLNSAQSALTTEQTHENRLQETADALLVSYQFLLDIYKTSYSSFQPSQLHSKLLQVFSSPLTLGV